MEKQIGELEEPRSMRSRIEKLRFVGDKNADFVIIDSTAKPEKTEESTELKQTRFNPILRRALDNRLKKTISLVPKDAQSLLELGCGSGYFLADIEKQFPSIKLTGVDLSEENLSFANAILKRTKLMKGDATNLKLPDSSFDVVAALELIEHVHDDKALLAEAWRVLKPHGTLILSTPDTEKPLWSTVWKLWNNTFRMRYDPHFREYKEEDFKKLLEESGFKVKNEVRALFGCIMIFECEKVLQPKQAKH